MSVKSKHKKSLAFILLAAVMIAVFSGCSIGGGGGGSNRSRPVNSEEKTSNAVPEPPAPPVPGESLYVTGVEDTLSMKDADNNDANTVIKLDLGEEVNLINDDSELFYYVSYNEGEKVGYVKKVYLTKNKGAVCKRQNGYISENCKLYSDGGNPISEMKKNDKIFVVAKEPGDSWCIYHMNSKLFGYVESRCISDKKISEPAPSSTTVSSAPAPSGPYVGYSENPPSDYTRYYVYNVKKYLAIRSAQAYDGYNELSKAYYGEPIYVINSNTGSKYWYCYAPSTRYYGYADSEYLTKSVPNPKPLTIEKYYVSGVNQYLALRDAQDYSGYNEIGQMKNNQEVYVIDKNTGSKYWYCYSVSLGLFGYADSNYLSKTKNSSSSSSVSSSEASSSVLEKEYPTGGPAEDSGEGYSKYYVSGVTQYLAIRSEQKTDTSNELGKAYEGDLVYVIDSDTGSNFWYCYSPTCKMYGFANSDYLSTSAPDAYYNDDDDNNTSSGETYVVSGTTNYLGLRSEPVTDASNVIGQIYEGDTVEVINKDNGEFWYVHSPTLNMDGYVKSSYLQPY